MGGGGCTYVKRMSYPYGHRPRAPTMPGRSDMPGFRRPGCVSQGCYQQLVTILAFATPNGLPWVDWTYRVTKCYTFSRRDYTPSTAKGL